MSTGKALRMRRLIDPDTQSLLMFAFSHGTSSPDLLEGYADPVPHMRAARAGGADCVLIAPGLINSLVPVLGESRDMGILAKVTSSASRGAVPHQESMIATVEHCAELGADGVVAMLAFTPDNEKELIAIAAQIGEACSRLGMPYLAEAEFPSSYGAGSGEDVAATQGATYLKRTARLCAELGADVIKSNWPGSAEGFAEIVESVQLPVVVAGGSRESDLDLLEKVSAAKSVGAAGCSVGRNIFQHENPEAITAALSAVVRGGDPRAAFEKHLTERLAA